MKTPKFLSKTISLVLCLVLMLNLCASVFATNEEKLRQYDVPVVSNEYGEDSVSLYILDGKYYMNLEDICTFTRFMLVDDGAVVTLKQGARRIEIEKDSGRMTDSGAVDQGTVALQEYEDGYLCEAIPMLVYLGAACSAKGDKLEVLMPGVTIWEAIAENYQDYYVNFAELYDGEDGVKLSLVCAMLADLLSGVSGRGLADDVDTHMEDALYQVLAVNAMEYASAKVCAAEKNYKIRNFLTSAAEGEESEAAVQEAIGRYAGFYLNTESFTEENQWQKGYLAGDFAEASQMAELINSQICQQAGLSAAQSGILALETALNSYQVMQNDNDTRNLLAGSAVEDMGWKGIADKIAEDMANDRSIAADVATENVVSYGLEAAEKSAEDAISAYTDPYSILTTTTDLNQLLAYGVTHEANKNSTADTNAIWLNAMQYDMLCSLTDMMEGDECFTNGEAMAKLRDMLTLYYRTAIAFAENMTQSIETSESGNKEQWLSHFATVADGAAEYLYCATNCTLVPIGGYSEIKNNVLTENWIVKNGAEQAKESQQDYDEVSLYNRYLLTGGYATIGSDYMDMEDAKVYTCLIDIDEDGVDELLVRLEDTNSMGPHGYETFSALLEIKKGVVTPVVTAYHGGGTMGGDTLTILYDNERRMYVLALDGYMRDGMQAGDSHVTIYSADTYKEKYKYVSFYYDTSNPYGYAEAADKVRSETSLYEEMGTDFYFYTVNGEYASRADYEKMAARFTKPESSKYQLQERNYRTPLGGSTSTPTSNEQVLQYFIENCDLRYFTEDEVSCLDAQELGYARNAIYAKSGYDFSTQELKAYFSNYSWYVPSVAPAEFTKDMLNSYQRKNLNIIRTLEKRLQGEE